MASEPFSFIEQLEFGNEWEEVATDHLHELFMSVSATNIDYDERPELQRAGIDTILSKEQPTIDIKTQRYEYTKSENLPIETVSVLEDQKPGWFYHADSDMVVWVYPNKAETNLYKTGYLMPLTDGLREWFDDRYADFEFKRIPNQTAKYGEYHTGIRLVPIDTFPDEYLVSFDPRLPVDRETPQSDILSWVDD